MPKLGLTMTEGTIARWDVAPGGRFATGDIIVVVETDKIAYDVEAPAPGILQEVLVAEGSAVPVGTPIGRWDVGDIKVSLDAPNLAAAAEPAAAAASAVEALPPVPARPPQKRGRADLATPYARRWRGKPASICAVSTAVAPEAGSKPPMSSAPSPGPIRGAAGCSHCRSAVTGGCL